MSIVKQIDAAIEGSAKTVNAIADHYTKTGMEIGQILQKDTGRYHNSIHALSVGADMADYFLKLFIEGCCERNGITSDQLTAKGQLLIIQTPEAADFVGDAMFHTCKRINEHFEKQGSDQFADSYERYGKHNDFPEVLN